MGENPIPWTHVQCIYTYMYMIMCAMGVNYMYMYIVYSTDCPDHTVCPLLCYVHVHVHVGPGGWNDFDFLMTGGQVCSLCSFVLLSHAA